MINIPKFKQKISNFATRSEKTSWKRKQLNLQKYIESTTSPLEVEMTELIATRNQLFIDLQSTGESDTTQLDKLYQLDAEIEYKQAERIHYLDNIHLMRDDMIDTCIHPVDELRVDNRHPNIVQCTFCNKRFIQSTQEKQDV